VEARSCLLYCRSPIIPRYHRYSILLVPSRTFSESLSPPYLTFHPSIKQKGANRPEVSKSLKGSSSSASHWLKANHRLQAIVGSILAVTHPTQYMAGLNMLNAIKTNIGLLREPAEFVKVLDCWHTPFSGVSAICNRETPRHKDVLGRHDWYDVLVTMGTHPTINFSLPGIRSSFAYCPGTVVALCGRILSHKVERSVEGDRACFAWFMREDVRSYLDMAAGPSTVKGVLGSGVL
jgi:hypothetical protein